ncbi:unnamed protein product [Protopolystoma xenopodis]|uniref:Uncharacterized protein n=1 Tax=Protopolystoma xenopodis TaxID=117903 RepID=A0A448WPQ0_9PLAT|nr:unnamed protein product [Protopolystoma xenopodis]
MHPDTTDLLVESPQFSTSIATTVCDNHLIHSAKAHQFDKLSPRDPPSMTIPCLESDLTELNSPPSMPMASSMSPLTFVSKRLLSDFIDSSNFNNEKHHQGNSQHGLLMNPGLSPVSSLFRAYEEVATQQPGRLTPHLMPGVGRCAFMDDSMEPEAESGLGHIEPKVRIGFFL